MITVRTGVELVCGLIAAVVIWTLANHPSAPVNAPMAAHVNPEVVHTPKVEARPAKVMVYAPKAKEQVALPAEVKNDPAVAILESSKISANEHPQTVTTVLDQNTGETKTFVTVDPLPWIAAENKRQLALGYGYTNGAVRVGRLIFADELIQIKALHMGVTTSIDTDGRYFAGLTVSYHF